MSVNLMLFTGQMFELAEVRQALGICDCLGCSQALTQPKPYIAAKKPADCHALPSQAEKPVPSLQGQLWYQQVGRTIQVLLTSL